MKSWSTFVVCLLISAGLWLVLTLSRSSSDVKAVPVVALCSLDGCSEKSVEPVDIAARCRASGFTLLYLSLFDRTAQVRFAPEDMLPCGDGVFEVRPSALYRYVKDIFPAGTTVESFLSPSVRFRFAPESSRKVPVLPVNHLECRSQYMAVGEMCLQPDSCLVYGDPQLIASVSCVRTRPVRGSDLHSDLHGVVSLESPSGLRLSVEEVTYSQSVRRFVEINREVPLYFRNVPDGVDFSCLQKSVRVSLRAEFPMRQNPFDLIEFFLDYSDFDRSLGGQCMLKAVNVPDGVFSWRSEPEVFDCFVVQ